MSGLASGLNANTNNKKSVRRDSSGKVIGEIIKVENPIYQTKEEIYKQYWGKQVIISNMKHTPIGVQWVGGVVRYYSKTQGGLTDIIIEMDGDEETYGRCDIFYIGPVFPSLGGLCFVRS